MKSHFKISITSNLDYEELTIQIRCNQNYFFAEINKDKGVDKMEIEILNPQNENKSWNFPLNELLEVLRLSKSTLLV